MEQGKKLGETNGEETTASTSNSPVIQDSNKSSRDKKDADKSNNTGGKVPFYKLFSFADAIDKQLMFIGTIAAVGNGITMPLMTVLLGNTINSFGTISHTKVVEDISKVSLKFVYLAIGAGLASFLQLSCWMITAERQAATLRSLYLQTILRQDVSFFDMETSTGEVVERMSGDTVLIQDAMGEKFGKVIQLLAAFVGGFTVAFIRGWLLTLVMLSCLPLLVLSGAMMGIILSKLASQGQRAYAEAAVVVDQTIGSIRTVASFTGEKRAIVEYNKSLLKTYRSGVREGLTSGLGFGTLLLVLYSSYALAIWFGAKMIIEKGYNGGIVINVIFAILTGSMSLGQTSPCLSSIATGQAAAFKMFEAIKRKPQIDASDTNGKILDDLCGDVELRDVSFSYPARPDELVFDGFSLMIPSGTTTALVGQSGSGKSTVVSLIERFYDPQAGEVLIDGINLKEFQLKWIRSKIGLVSQEPVLFTSTIKDNITYGKEDATDEEIRSAAELANASKFIDKLPQGLNTMVGQHGTQLSGGQKQRVAIARAILKSPRILLLDEATSALDAESERIVQEALDRVMITRTTVIVAHRLSTVKNADTIAVIQQGKIVQKGSHTELLKNPDGAYCQLIRLQEMSKATEGHKQLQHPISSQEISRTDSGRHPSQRISFLRSISRGSSGLGSSSRHSFTAPFGVPVGINTFEAAQPAESDDITPVSKKYETEVSLLRLASLNKPEIPVLLLGAIASISSGVILPVFALLLSSAIKVFYEPKDKLQKDSRFWSLMFFILALACFIAIPAKGYFLYVAGYKLINRFRSMCFEKVVHMEISWFDNTENSSGAIGARLSSDAASVRSIVGDALGLLVQNIATALTGLVIAFEANWELSLVILVLLPLLVVNGYVQAKSMRGGFSRDSKKLYEEASQVASDAVGSIRTVASFCAEDKVMQMYHTKCEGLLKTGIKQGIVSSIGFGVALFFLFSVYAISFYAGARLVDAGKATFPEIFRVFFALTMTTVGITQSGSLSTDFAKARRAAASVFSILDQKSKINANDESGLTLDNVKGEIEFHHVSFTYPTRPDIQVFRDLSLTIRSGKTVALVGESGCGKSTVISLFQRFYDPDSGDITLDGTEIQKLQIRWLRQQMGLVSQEPVLFNESIRANIAYGKEGDVTELEILAAAELANAHKFISALQQGYDTKVGERGIQLSGGQKQRVAIARAIMKAPKILLLDEATSALDAQSERVVQDALDRVMVNRTTVVVAHRISTIKGADLIAVVKNGVIAEKGKHDTLINIKHGLYASLVALHSSSTS